MSEEAAEALVEAVVALFSPVVASEEADKSETGEPSSAETTAEKAATEDEEAAEDAGVPVEEEASEPVVATTAADAPDTASIVAVEEPTASASGKGESAAESSSESATASARLNFLDIPYLFSALNRSALRHRPIGNRQLLCADAECQSTLTG